MVFEGETHQDIVRQVKRWLASQEADEDGHLTPRQAIVQGLELTKDALRIVAAAAPKPIAESELVKALTDMGHRITDATREALVQGLDSMEHVTDGGLLRRVSERSASAVYEMNAAVAKAILKGMIGGR
ncbi:MAG: hypothetical protein KatS3mg008_1073 [Acidimicrobiales bacterium]|nr:MAG: hypothetical protein KatS3mg008_1073 [Acidimicrobiales bacterium]